MRKTVILWLCIVLILGLPVVSSAVVPDGYTVIDSAYYIDGTLYEIATNANGTRYYFANGVVQVGAGLVFFDGHYMYIRSEGNIFVNGGYYVSKTNNLLPAAYYDFDANGYLINPPSLPADWENQWFEDDPTATVPTDPPETEPPVTIPPVTEPKPSEPVPGLDLSADPSEIMGLLTAVVAICVGWFVQLIFGTGFGVVFMSGFFLWLLYRFYLSRLFGVASDMAIRKRLSERSSDRAKKNKEN